MRSFSFCIRLGALALVTFVPAYSFAENQGATDPLGRHGKSTTAHANILRDNSDQTATSSENAVAASDQETSKIDHSARAKLGKTPVDTESSKTIGRHGRSHMAHTKILSDQ